MNDATLESLAARVDALEKAIASERPGASRKDWRRMVGVFRDSEFMREFGEECVRSRDAEGAAASRETSSG